MLESMYASLKLEARIDYHLSTLENTCRLLRTKVAGEKNIGTIWYNTYELVDEAIVKLKMIKSLLAKYRYTGLYVHLTDALQIANELTIKVNSKPALPSHKDNIRLIVSEITYEIRSIIKSINKEHDPSSFYTKAF